jgi:hypothetical protein
MISLGAASSDLVGVSCPILRNPVASTIVSKISAFKSSSRSFALNDSMQSFSHGLLGSSNSVLTPRRPSQLRTAGKASSGHCLIEHGQERLCDRTTCVGSQFPEFNEADRRSGAWKWNHPERAAFNVFPARCGMKKCSKGIQPDDIRGGA